MSLWLALWLACSPPPVEAEVQALVALGDGGAVALRTRGEQGALIRYDRTGAARWVQALRHPRPDSLGAGGRWTWLHDGEQLHAWSLEDGERLWSVRSALASRGRQQPLLQDQLAFLPTPDGLVAAGPEGERWRRSELGALRGLWASPDALLVQQEKRVLRLSQEDGSTLGSTPTAPWASGVAARQLLWTDPEGRSWRTPLDGSPVRRAIGLDGRPLVAAAGYRRLSVIASQGPNHSHLLALAPSGRQAWSLRRAGELLHHPHPASGRSLLADPLPPRGPIALRQPNGLRIELLDYATGRPIHHELLPAGHLLLPVAGGWSLSGAERIGWIGRDGELHQCQLPAGQRVAPLQIAGGIGWIFQEESLWRVRLSDCHVAPLPGQHGPTPELSAMPRSPG